MGLVGPITSWARPALTLRGLVGALALAILAWPLLTAGVDGPGFGPAAVIAAPEAPRTTPAARIERVGDKVILTGSVAYLFNSGSFTGPNEAEKVNRARLTPDGVTVSSQFAKARTRLAALRHPATVVPSVPAGDSVPAIQVASLDPDTNSALGAIDQVVPMPPMPMMATPKLAYARETTPPTAFDLTVDKYGDKISQKDIWCMTEAIYFEARGESYRGQIAVGQVVMNRLAHPIYPKTICGVVFQNEHMRNACQFSFACDGIPETVNDPKAWKQASEIARGVINGSLYLTDVANATHYHATYVYPDWAPRLKRVTKIGHHIFYRFKHAA